MSHKGMWLVTEIENLSVATCPVQERHSLTLRNYYLYDPSWLTLHKKWSFPLRISSVNRNCRNRRKLQIWSHLLKKFLMENFIFCAVLTDQLNPIQWAVWQKVALVLIFSLVWECCFFHIKFLMLYCSRKNRMEHFRDAEKCVVWQSLSRSSRE